MTTTCEMTERVRMARGELLTASAVAEFAGYSRATIYQKVAKGEFPPPRAVPGSPPRWLKADVLEWLGALPKVGGA